MALGIVLTPYGKMADGSAPAGVSYSYGNRGDYLCPEDPGYNTRATAALYHDTQLGGLRGLRGGVLGAINRWRTRRAYRAFGKALGMARNIPTDAELSMTRGYLPSVTGEVFGYQNGRAVHVPSPLQVNARPFGPLNGLGEPATTDDIVSVLTSHNDRIFALSLVSTTAVAVSALLTVFRTIKLIKDDK